MSKANIRFNQLNLVVEDMDAAVAFYQALGMTVRFDGGEWPPGSGARHVALDNGEGAIFELDNLAMARIYHGGWRSPDFENRPVVLGVSLASREAVDERYQALTAAGYTGRQEPYDAFFGARYAVVRDPAGNDVGLMSPIDQDRRFTPTT
jgi:catechol 2,3-dioxygenase-like lactoylglutathione lyase family enzyme